MGQTIGEVLQKAHAFQLSQKEVLENYNHIPLTDEEIIEAMIWAKRKKEDDLRKADLKAREEQMRKLKEQLWNFDVVKSFMMKRAEDLFQGRFELDTNNEGFFDLLCMYFSDNDEFIDNAPKFGEDNPSLTKGLLIPGNFGTGKSWIMKVFQKNRKQTYYIRSAKDIAQAYLNSEDKAIPEEFIKPFKNPINDSSVFHQQISGLCIDDLGAESKKNNYGNVINVIGDLIEQRYSKGFTGPLLHGSTNLSAQELLIFYGERVTSRMREIFNFIELPGNDRRK